MKHNAGRHRDKKKLFMATERAYIVLMLIYRLIDGRFTTTIAVTAATINTPTNFEILI